LLFRNPENQTLSDYLHWWKLDETKNISEVLIMKAQFTTALVHRGGQMRGRILLVFGFLFIVFGTSSSGAGLQSIQGGRISGQVLDAVTGEPLKDARVILQRRGSGDQQEVLTDDKGLFVLEGIPPGSYLLHPEQTGYLTNRLPSGSARPVPISMNIEAGGHYPVSFRLVRTGSISGRIYDVDRQPVANAEIQILLSQYGGFGLPIVT
jgi:hypothetical protein